MFFRNLILIILFIISNSVYSASISGKMTGGNLEWYSAIPEGSNLKPAQWFITNNIPPGLSFTQQSIAATSQNIVFSRNGTQDTVATRLDLSSVEYISPNFQQLMANPSGNTAITSSGSTISAAGLGMGNSFVLLNSQVTPFTHYRPIFSLPSIVNDFKGKPPGNYSGIVTIVLTYNYERNGVIVSNIITETLNFELEHIPSVINSVVFDQYSKDMNILYNLNKTVSGEVEFSAVAQGVFPNGLNIKAVSSLNNFSLYNQVDYIPYNITCIPCDKSLVINGNSLTQFDAAKITDSNQLSISFNIKVSFTDQTLSQITGGNFTDTFTLMFTPNI